MQLGSYLVYGYWALGVCALVLGLFVLRLMYGARVARWTYRVAVKRWPDVLPWCLRWCLPPERPMLMFVGRRGQGKTAIATSVARGRMLAGERVYANYEIKDKKNGLRAGRVYSLLDCIDLERCTVVIDEANMWTNSRMWQKVPPQILEAWQESRKSAVSFIFTSQHESRCDLVVRELADFIMVCGRVPLIPKWVPFFRVFRTHLEDVNEVRRSGMAPAEYFWLSSDVFGAYNTQERLGGARVAAMRAYQDALKRGEDPDELGVSLPPRREPTCRYYGWWINRGLGFVPGAEALSAEAAGAKRERVVLPPLSGVVVLDGADRIGQDATRERVLIEVA